MSQVHLEALQQCPDAQVIGIWGRSVEKTSSIAQRYNIIMYQSEEELLTDKQIDLIIISLPTFLHAHYVGLAAQHGKHLFCEKPMALSVEACESMIHACQSAGVHLFVGHVLRFFSAYRQLHDKVIQGAVGQPGVLRLSRKNKYPHGGSSWYADEAKSGGLIYDLLIHDLDWLHWSFGQVDRITARTVKRDAPHAIQYTLVLAHLKNGAIAHLEGSWAHTDFSHSVELSGDQGMLVYQDTDTNPIQLKLHPQTKLHNTHAVPDENKVIVPTEGNRSPFVGQWQHVLNVLQGKEASLLKATDAMYAVHLAACTKASIETGKPIDVSWPTVLGGERS
jgi:predicted dehydrogenase